MSRPARGKLLLVMTFVLTLCAGIVVGMGLSKQVNAGQATPAAEGKPTPPPTGNPGSWFADKLNLSPAQTEQMKTIWSEAMEGQGEELFNRRRSLYRERDRAIEALYSDEQRAERERLKKEYDVKLADNSKQREKLVQAAVGKTKAMLTPEQREIYEKMLKERAERDRERHRGPSTRSSTQPSDRPPGSFDRRRGEESRGGPGRDGSGCDGSGRDGSGRDGSGRDGSGRGSGPDASAPNPD